jgi:SAM-dependent methyltransferase
LPVLARAARTRLAPLGDRCEIRVERGTETTLPDGIADVCIAQTVLCHLPEAEGEATLARLLRLTRRGGRVVSADQDAETWVVDHPDRAVTRRLVVVDTSLESYGFRIAIDRARTAAEAGWITDGELDGWVRGLEDEAAAGRFFSSLNFYVAAGTVA